MIGEICSEIKNYFTYSNDKYLGDFVISEGQISPIIDIPTDYIRIIGSRLNDGVHKVSDLVKKPLQDESWHGAIWVMSPPADFLALVEEIEAWQEKNGSADSAAMSPFASESFGGYSYSKASGGSIEGGASSVPTWQGTFASRLKLYRRINAL